MSLPKGYITGQQYVDAGGKWKRFKGIYSRLTGKGSIKPMFLLQGWCAYVIHKGRADTPLFNLLPGVYALPEKLLRKKKSNHELRTQRDCWQALLDGKTLMHGDGSKYRMGEDGRLLEKEYDGWRPACNDFCMGTDYYIEGD